LRKKVPNLHNEKEIQIIKLHQTSTVKLQANIKQRHLSKNTTHATTVTIIIPCIQQHTPATRQQTSAKATSKAYARQSSNKQQTHNTIHLTTSSSPTPTTTNETTQLPEMMSESGSDSESTNVPKQNLKIFPDNISKGLRRQLKKSNTNKTMKLNEILVDVLGASLLDICLSPTLPHYYHIEFSKYFLN
ncbi:unnamed protein product, partial [Ceratitis capitata]